MNNWEQNAQSWYASLERAAEPVKETKKKKRLSTSWKAVIAVLLALALIAGSSMLFSSGEEKAELPKPDFTLPESEEELPDSFQEFFENFYVREDKKGEVRVQKAETVPEFTLEFSEPGEELTLQELYRQCADSIVSIAGYTDGTAGYYWGSGIVLSKDGLILTNTLRQRYRHPDGRQKLRGAACGCGRDERHRRFEDRSRRPQARALRRQREATGGRPRRRDR